MFKAADEPPCNYCNSPHHGVGDCSSLRHREQTAIKECFNCKSKEQISSSLISVMSNDRIIMCRGCGQESDICPNLSSAVYNWNERQLRLAGVTK